MTTLVLNLCMSCKRNQGGGVCTSFPEGIPEDIWWGQADHREPIAGEEPYWADPNQLDLLHMWDAKWEAMKKAHLVAAGKVETYYDAGQPRRPAGTEGGGRWMPSGGVPNLMPDGNLNPMPLETAEIEAKLFAGVNATCRTEHLDPLLKDMKTQPSANLARLQVEGEPNLFTRHEREIPRKKMPQLPENVDGLAPFMAALAANGASAEIKVIDPRILHMTQNQLDSAKVGFIYDSIKHGGWREGTVMFISRDGDILDGHHRWAAACAARLTGTEIDITVLQVDLPIDELLKVADTVSLAKKSMEQGFAARGRRYAFGEEPTEPPPNLYEPWIWFAGKWWYVITDGGDEVPVDLDYLDEQEKET